MADETDDARWQSVVRRDQDADGAFVYAVRTTGVYCRPSCPARRARCENVEFYRTPNDAERAGYRACCRCRPKEQATRSQHTVAITRVCELIADAKTPPALASLASAVGLSPSHLHRVFKAHTGLTPKAYAAGIFTGKIRAQLSRTPTVTAAMHRAGFRSSSRFYANTSKALDMEPATFKGGGKDVTIHFAVAGCSMGCILVAATPRGICAITLGDNPSTLTQALGRQFPRASLVAGDKAFARRVAKVVAFVERPAAGLDLPLDVQGTAFEQRVWAALRRIPCGETRTYAQVAAAVGKPTASRAVAKACAANRIAVAIPCHRVVRGNGSLSGYRWGVQRKARLLQSEGANLLPRKRH